MQSESLFPTHPILPAGFTYYPDFVDVAREQELISHIQSLPLHAMMFQGFEAKRRVISFGYDYSFDNRKLSKGKEIPLYFQPLIAEVAKECNIDPGQFTELLATEYPEGSVINWHRDAPPFELIAGISLLSDCTFKLRPHDKSKQNRRSVISVPVARRSLYIIKGEARSEWQHSISPVKRLRYSITLRTLKSL
jgi:alkylated DNA repair dioxygenase AlkB